MAIPILLPMLLAMSPQTIIYGAAVTFEDGKCIYWTGDVGFTPAEFREDLERFDVANAIIIGHPANVPRGCVREAQRQARLAGFKDVRAMIDPEAGPVGPGNF